jgi:hypothetical protein
VAIEGTIIGDGPQRAQLRRLERSECEHAGVGRVQAPAAAASVLSSPDQHERGSGRLETGARPRVQQHGQTLLARRAPDEQKARGLARYSAGQARRG